MNRAIKVQDLRKVFGGIVGIRGVSFEIHSEERVGVIGPNGAGKSTLFNLLAGQLKPDSGSIMMGGAEIRGDPAFAIARRGVGRSFQQANTFSELSVYENVEVGVLARRRMGSAFWIVGDNGWRHEVLKYLEMVDLGDLKDEVAGELSLGDQKRVELAIALAGRPGILLLDEPTAGMSRAESMQVVELIKRIHDETRITLLFTEHDLSVVFSLAQRLIVLHDGEIIADGEVGTVRASERVQKIYFGKEQS